jgi:hypothetical protein
MEQTNFYFILFYILFYFDSDFCVFVFKLLVVFLLEYCEREDDVAMMRK